MSARDWRGWFLAAVTVAGIAAALSIPPIPQDLIYHEFADRRTFVGIPNFCDVFSSLAFVLVGAFGLSRVSGLRPASPRTAFIVFCLGAVLVGFGSACYHLAPSTPALLWDRLPMSIAFMALFSMVVRDRISEQFGNRLLWPLVLAGMASVGYWYWTELQGHGDLRAYAVVQFLPLLLMPLMLVICSGKELRTPWLWGTLGTYALAKVAEHFDKLIFDVPGMVSGHSLKHVLASLAVLWAVYAVPGLRR